MRITDEEFKSQLKIFHKTWFPPFIAFMSIIVFDLVVSYPNVVWWKQIPHNTGWYILGGLAWSRCK